MLAWFLTLIVAAGLAFVVPDGPFRSAQFIVWLGIVLLLGGSVWFVVTAFQEHLAHGVMVLFVPFYFLVYLNHNWSEARRPFCTGLGGLLMVCLGAFFYSATGTDVGKRPLLALKSKPSALPPIIDERNLPLRPPPITADTPTDEARSHWREFMASLMENHLSVLDLAKRKEKAMVARHGADRVVTVYVARVYDAETFDAVVQSLRPFAGPAPDDFFVCTNAGFEDVSTLMAILAPVNDVRALADAINMGNAASVLPNRGKVHVLASNAHIPAQFLQGDSPVTASTTLATAATASPRPPARQVAAPGVAAAAPRAIALSPEGNLRLPLPPSTEVLKTLYPATNSRFVAVGDNSTERSSRESWNIEERKRVGVLPGKLALHGRLALSPDGTLLSHLGGNQEVEIWSFLTGTLVQRIRVNTVIDLTMFVAPDRLLVSTPFQNTYHVYDVGTGEKLQSITSPVGINRDSPAISPDGKSLALAANGRGSAGVYSLVSGTLTGDWAIPRARQYVSMECMGMTFAHDGSEVAGLFDDTKFTRFMAWDATGKVVANALVSHAAAASVPKPLLGYLGRPLEWLPDRSGWLVYGRVVVDKQTGTPAWTLPENRNDSPTQPRRLLESGALLVVSGPRGEEVLQSVPLPLDQIGEAIQRIRRQ